MARSLLLVCLWAVVLLVVIEKCAGKHEQPQACTEDKVKVCEKTGKSCNPDTGDCFCKLPKQEVGENCTACTEDKVKVCEKTGKSCNPDTGDCFCKLPKQEVGEKCTACTEDKVKVCEKTGKSCNPDTGDCFCKFPKQEVGEKCTGASSSTEAATMQSSQAPDFSKEEPSSTSEPATTQSSQTPDVITEKSSSTTDATTTKSSLTPDVTTGEKSPGTTATTTPTAPTQDSSKGKKSPATEATVTTSAPPGPEDCKEKLKECENTKKTSCDLINGTATCVCPPSMKETKNGDCFVAKKLTITFKLKSRQRRSAPSSNTTCAMDRDKLIREITQSIPSVIVKSIVCNGSDVTFDVFAENEENEKNITDLFEKCEPDDCQLGARISIEPGSAAVIQTNLCDDEAYQKLEKEMGLKCQYANETRMVCNNETSTAIGKATVQGIPFEVCKALPCTKTTCDDDKKHCVQGSCVCKPQYRDVDGECKSICQVIPSVCPVGSTCVLGQGDQSFYCECPPKLTGPLCTRENKPLQTAKLNIVVVGVVLASLLLLCFVVSASIISRLRKKAQGPSFSKDCERRPQRELRGYDGPYKASDPASLHRGRDHTSL